MAFVWMLSILPRPHSLMCAGTPHQCLSDVIKVYKIVKFSHTRYQALGPELSPVYRQSARRWLTHPADSRLPLLFARPAVTSVAFTRWRQPYTRSYTSVKCMSYTVKCAVKRTRISHVGHGRLLRYCLICYTSKHLLTENNIANAFWNSQPTVSKHWRKRSPKD